MALPEFISEIGRELKVMSQRQVSRALVYRKFRNFRAVIEGRRL